LQALPAVRRLTSHGTGLEFRSRALCLPTYCLGCLVGPTVVAQVFDLRPRRTRRTPPPLHSPCPASVSPANPRHSHIRNGSPYVASALEQLAALRRRMQAFAAACLARLMVHRCGQEQSIFEIYMHPATSAFSAPSTSAAQPGPPPMPAGPGGAGAGSGGGGGGGGGGTASPPQAPAAAESGGGGGGGISNATSPPRGAVTGDPQSAGALPGAGGVRPGPAPGDLAHWRWVLQQACMTPEQVRCLVQGHAYARAPFAATTLSGFWAL
jgi:hypothetical protein